VLGGWPWLSLRYGHAESGLRGRDPFILQQAAPQRRPSVRILWPQAAAGDFWLASEPVSANQFDRLPKSLHPPARTHAIARWPRSVKRLPQPRLPPPIVNPGSKPIPLAEAKYARAGSEEQVLAAERERAVAALAASRATDQMTGQEMGEGDEPADGVSRTLVNEAGVLRPLPGMQPLRSVEEEATAPMLLPSLRLGSLYDSHGRLVVPPPLYGSREILEHQNQMADRDGLDRVRDDADLMNLRREKKLVPLPESQALHVDYRLPENRRFSRPWTAAFLTLMADDFYANFHVPLQVDSAVRTVEVQQRLMRINGNAAPTSGDTASPHLTGQAVDIAKGGLTRVQIAWMRTYLQPLINLGKIDVEEEFQQSCFHISVYKSYLPIAPTHLSIATARQPAQETAP
jgi:hypothetical protein